MCYSALEVAKYIISSCCESGTPISNLKLQKLLYFIQGEFFKVKGQPAFEDDLSAWQLGPVVSSVYYEFCVYAGTPILNTYHTKICDDDKVIIDTVVSNKKDMPAWKLVDETHQIGTPWHKIYNEKGNRSIIPKYLIAEHFSSLAACV